MASGSAQHLGRTLHRQGPVVQGPEVMDTQHALERIARALNMPVASFFADDVRPEATIAQAADLVAAFVTIGSPAARRTCLAFVRAMARS